MNHSRFALGFVLALLLVTLWEVVPDYGRLSLPLPKPRRV